MGRSARRSVAASLAIAWTMTGASGYALAASGEVAATPADSGPKLAIGLATVGFLVVLLLLLRLARIRRQGGATTDVGDGAAAADPSGPQTSTTPRAEADLPRWRRPSVVAARYGLSIGATKRTDRLAFENQPPTELPVERLVVRYDAVPLVDEPDDVHGRTIDELSAGDEVEVVERESLWVHVRTPAGRAGWVPAMTLATLDELPPDVWAVAEAEPNGTTAPADDAPQLEALLEAIVAQRRSQAVGAAPVPAAAPAGDVREKRARAARASRATPTPRPATRRKAATSES